MVSTVENIVGDQCLSPIEITIMSKDTEDHFKFVHKVVDFLDYLNRRICVTPLRYNVDKLENSSSQIQLIARKKEEERLHQVDNVNYKLVEYICFFDI